METTCILKNKARVMTSPWCTPSDADELFVVPWASLVSYFHKPICLNTNCIFAEMNC